MPVLNREDSADVDEQIARIFSASDNERIGEARRLFVEILDFSPASGAVSLAKARKGVSLPENAELLATMSGVSAVYVAMDDDSTNRVRKGEAAEAAKRISEELAGDLLLVFMNSANSQLHFVYPTFEGTRPALRRMVIERDLPRRTVVEQLSKIFWEREDTGDIRGALEHAYDVEAVTTRFFQDYKRVFDVLIDSVIGFGDDAAEQEAKKLFVQTLFNRLMFVYFLSRKGWLAFNGEKDYLKALWDDYANLSESPNFYVSRLQPLFFAGLNNPQAFDLKKDNPVLHSLIGDVPFLNGGLFDKFKDEVRTGVSVPNESIKLIFDDLFDPYNFTVMESTPLDVEVAVDPEMLGKVFEELVTGRHESGSYYTPRPVVSFMCRESLKGYLDTKNTGATKEAIQAFVSDDHDTSGLGIATAPLIADALNEIKVIDPACGSGAYLLGMMQELVDLKTALYSDQLSHEPKDLYDLKLQIIQDSLYGADIDEFAVNIAMLRLWLSLSIDYEGGRPEPLPNLDFKIVCGDSLTGTDPSPSHFGDLFRHRIEELADQLAELKHNHMSSTGQLKSGFAEEISGILNELRECLSGDPEQALVVDWRVEFAEVFTNDGGFDVAIANPPYVRMELFKDLKPMLIRNFTEIHRERSDLYCYFYARALQLLKDGGILAFISSNKWLRSNYGSGLRKYVRDHCNVTSVTDFGELPVFQAAATFPMIMIASKDGPASKPFLFTQIRSLQDPYPDILELQNLQGHELPAELLAEDIWILASSSAVSQSKS